jgi:hypothetical protein
MSYSFHEYCRLRYVAKLRETCIRRRVSLQPYVEMVAEIIDRDDLSNQEKYDEIMQTAKKWAGNIASGVGNMVGGASNMITRGVGNLAGRAVGAMQNMGQQFGKGFNNGRGAMTGQQPGGQQSPGGMPNAQAGNTQGANAQGQNAQAQAGGDVGQQIKTVQQMVGQITQSTGQVNNLLQQLVQAVGQK